MCDAHWRKRTGQPRGQRVPQGAGAVAIRRLDAGLAGQEERVSENCKCGRDGKHGGRCWARRGLSGPPGKSESGGEGEKLRRGRPKIPRVGAVARVREGELEWAAAMRAEAERLELRAKKLRQALALLIETD